MSQDKQTTRAVLGPAAALGNLYDVRYERILAQTIIKSDIPDEAIATTDTPSTSYELAMNDTFEEKFSKLDLSAEIGASFLGGLLTLKGSGNFLSQNKTSTHMQQASAICNITTKSEVLRLSNSHLLPCLDLDALEHEDATHVIVGIQWGARSVVTVRSSKESNDEILKFGGALSAGVGGSDNTSTPAPSGKLGALTGLIKSIGQAHAGAAFESDNELKKSASSFDFSINADIVPNGNIPTDYEGVCKFIQSVPDAMQKANKGKGVPLSYQLVPIAEIAKMFKRELAIDQIVNKLEEETLQEFVVFFDSVALTRQKLNDYYDLLVANKYCIPQKQLDKAKAAKSKAVGAEKRFKKDFGDMLYAVRNGDSTMQDLTNLLADFNAPGAAPEALPLCGEYVEKMKLAKMLVSRGVKYLPDSINELDSARIEAEQKDQDLYIVHLNEVTRAKSEWSATFRKLMDLITNNDESYVVVVVDCDVGEQRKLDKAIIQQVRGQNVIVADVVADSLSLAGKNLLKWNKGDALQSSLNFTPPPGRRIIRAKCPGKDCSKNGTLEWICPSCREEVCYGYTDVFIYCNCGRYAVESATFKCGSELHRTSYAQYKNPSALKTVLENLQAFEEYNILILGETGVGKSTFINSFVNYMLYGSLEEALADEGDIHYAIPCSFTFSEGGVSQAQHRVVVGKESSVEKTSSQGQSATQKTVTYRFILNGKAFRLIDTPGIGDTRGIAQDMENVKDILNTLESVDRISTVLFLLQPNSARLTTTFNFCLTELLSHLHRDTTKNIVFGCTNSRGSNFAFGDTRVPLESLLKEKHTGIELGHNNSFFFDAEGFRYLAAAKALDFPAVPQDEYYETWLDSAQKTWKKSSAQATRLLKVTTELPVHQVQRTLHMNRTRSMITDLTKPMVAINLAIDNTTKDLTAQQKSLQDLDEATMKAADLVNLKKIKYRVPVRENLPRPQTVCSHENCSEPLPNNEYNGKAYKVQCHDECYIDTLEETPNPEGLIQCIAFDNKGECKVCHHPLKLHLHVTYRIRMEDREKPDPMLEQQLANSRGLQESKKIMTENLKIKVDALNGYKLQVNKALARFGVYLKNNALVAYNDATARYLEFEISTRKTAGKLDEAADLQNQLTVYNQQFTAIDSAIKSGSETDVTDDDLKRIISELHEMPIYGSQLKAIMEGGTTGNRQLTPGFSVEVPLHRGWKGKLLKGVKEATGMISGIGRVI